MKRVLLSILITYCLIVTFYYIKQREFIYPPAVSTFQPVLSDSPDMEWIEVKTDDGLTLKSWYKPAKDNKPTLLVFHGNGGTVWHLIPHARLITEEGYGLLLAEYRYYAGNPGKPTEEGLYKDADAHYYWLQENDIKNIILYGQSLGSAPAVYLAAKFDTTGLILEVPFSSALDVATYQLPFLPFLSAIMHDQYRNDQKIGDVDEPLLIGLAAKDHLVPAHLGQKLFDLANEPKVLKIYEQATHDDIYNHGFGHDLINFVEDLNNEN